MLWIAFTAVCIISFSSISGSPTFTSKDIRTCIYLLYRLIEDIVSVMLDKCLFEALFACRVYSFADYSRLAYNNGLIGGTYC